MVAKMLYKCQDQTHNFITWPLYMDVRYAGVQQRQWLKLYFDVEVFVAKQSDAYWKNSAMKSTIVEYTSDCKCCRRRLLCEKQIVQQNCIGVVQSIHFEDKIRFGDVNTLDKETSLNSFRVFSSFGRIFRGLKLWSQQVWVFVQSSQLPHRLKAAKKLKRKLETPKNRKLLGSVSVTTTVGRVRTVHVAFSTLSWRHGTGFFDFALMMLVPQRVKMMNSLFSLMLCLPGIIPCRYTCWTWIFNLNRREEDRKTRVVWFKRCCSSTSS